MHGLIYMYLHIGRSLGRSWPISFLQEQATEIIGNVVSILKTQNQITATLE